LAETRRAKPNSAAFLCFQATGFMQSELRWLATIAIRHDCLAILRMKTQTAADTIFRDPESF
jgi:hypothetical protein